MSNPIQVILGLVLILFLPGYLLVKALFPRRTELDADNPTIFSIGLGLGLSVVISILDLLVLALIPYDPETRMGYVRSPYIEISLLILCLIFFVVGVIRGGHPWLGWIHPSLYRVPAPFKLPRGTSKRIRKKREEAILAQFEEYALEREELRKKIKEYEGRTKLRAESSKKYYTAKLEECRARLKELDEKIRFLEEQRWYDLAYERMARRPKGFEEIQEELKEENNKENTGKENKKKDDK
ncbi:MAG: DUF1616 domain-containing protein [Thermoplasmata archaeon]